MSRTLLQIIDVAGPSLGAQQALLPPTPSRTHASKGDHALPKTPSNQGKLNAYPPPPPVVAVQPRTAVTPSIPASPSPYTHETYAYVSRFTLDESSSILFFLVPHVYVTSSERASAMRNMSVSALVLTPGLDVGPSMVNVLPEPVCP